MRTTIGALLLLAVALSSTTVLAQRGGPAQLATSVIITNFYDLEGNVQGMKPCEFIVAKSKGFNTNHINFVLTVSAIGSENALGTYAYKDTQGNLLNANANTIARWQSGLTNCFRAAVNAGFSTIHVLPHVDPVQTKNGKGFWRNIAKFDPLQKVNGFSYEDVLLKPAALALNSVMTPTTVVQFSMSGEQGLSVFTFPKNWMIATDRTKALVAANGKNKVKHIYGHAFNWDKVCGCVEPSEPDPILYNNTYVQRYNDWVKKGGPKTIDLAGVKTLLAKSDFIGVSGYASMKYVNVPGGAASPLPEMERSIQTIAYEFSFFGVSIKDLLLKQGKQLIYVEQGLGGTLDNGNVAPDIAYITKYPFKGSWPLGGYTKAGDPWQKLPFKFYRRSFYQTLCKWAYQGGGPLYRVDAIYTWSVGSFDVHGAHPVSTSSQGTFADKWIQANIKALNSRKPNWPALTTNGP